MSLTTYTITQVSAEDSTDKAYYVCKYPLKYKLACHLLGVWLVNYIPPLIF